MVKNNLIYKILFLVGLCPFLAPFIYYFILIYIHGTPWELFDLIVFWSVIYWPTYIAGIVAMAFSAYKLKK